MKITIDPGHGQNTNRSPNNKAYVEGTQMWKLGQKLQKALESYGFEVINTRPNISDNPSLSTRGKAAGNSGSNLFLSLHSNAPSASSDGSYDKTISGVCACYSQKDKAFNQPLSKKLAETVGDLMGNGVKAVFYNDYPNKPGTDYFGVLRYSAASGCPHAIIIEHGYHTNVYESNWLLEDANLERLALEEARVVAEYFGVKKSEEVKTVTVTLTQVKNGSRCAEVKTVQRLLSSLGYKGKDEKSLSLDGIFGTNTDLAVKAFQKAQNLSVDGIVGIKTWNALLK